MDLGSAAHEGGMTGLLEDGDGDGGRAAFARVRDDEEDDGEGGGARGERAAERDLVVNASFDVEASGARRATRRGLLWKMGRALGLVATAGRDGRAQSFERIGEDDEEPAIELPKPLGCGRRLTCGLCECLECAAICSLLFIIATLLLVIRQNVCWTAEDELQLYLDLEDANGPLELFEQGGTPPVPLVHAHSHNDYQQAVPVKLALAAGFCSIEADVFLRDGRLYTGHVQPSSHDLADQYLRPLVALASRDKDRPGPINPIAGRLGLCEQQTLMVDMKSSTFETWEALETILESVNNEAGFRVFECYDQDGEPIAAPEVARTKLSPVQVIMSGISPSDLSSLAARLLGRSTHCTRIDGRIDPDNLGLDDANLVRTLGMMSSAWNDSFTPKLKVMVSAIHGAAPRAKVRFWDAPENPDFWQVLLDAGVDLISTDRISGLHAFLLGDTL